MAAGSPDWAVATEGNPQTSPVTTNMIKAPVLRIVRRVVRKTRLPELSASESKNFTIPDFRYD